MSLLIGREVIMGGGGRNDADSLWGQLLINPRGVFVQGSSQPGPARRDSPAPHSSWAVVEGLQTQPTRTLHIVIYESELRKLG